MLSTLSQVSKGSSGLSAEVRHTCHCENTFMGRWWEALCPRLCAPSPVPGRASLVERVTVQCGRGIPDWSEVMVRQQINYTQGISYKMSFFYFSVNIQDVILQENLEKEDQILVSLAGLKQVCPFT